MSDWAGKTPTADEWRGILERHAKWLYSEKGGQRADLRGAVLRDADLRGADLRGAVLRDAVLRDADLRGADLRGAVLTGAVLRDAVLRDAVLTDADLRDADLTRAVLTDADLTDADLRGADLRGADLTGADLTGARDVDLVIARTRILPEGDLIGWKKCQNGVIVQLLIPRSARRSHAFGRKCRAEAAVPMAIFPEGAEAKSLWTGDPRGSEEPLVYRINETIRPREPWSEEWTQECASGLHFYITRAEAEAHQ